MLPAKLGFKAKDPVDLRPPNRAFLSKTRPPLIERHPLPFWTGISAILAAVIVVLLFTRFGTR